MTIQIINKKTAIAAAIILLLLLAATFTYLGTKLVPKCTTAITTTQTIKEIKEVKKIDTIILSKPTAFKIFKFVPITHTDTLKMNRNTCNDTTIVTDTIYPNRLKIIILDTITNNAIFGRRIKFSTILPDTIWNIREVQTKTIQQKNPLIRIGLGIIAGGSKANYSIGGLAALQIKDNYQLQYQYDIKNQLHQGAFIYFINFKKNK